MNNNRRILYNAEEVIQNLENILDDLKVFRYDINYKTLLGDNFTEKLSYWDTTIRTRTKDPFTLVVCGEFKRGKSSIINALLGEEVVTTNVTTETVTLNKIKYGVHSNEAVLAGGKRMILSDEDIKKENLEQIITQSDTPITQLELYRPIELLKDITIIDTPGLNDSLQDFAPMVEYALQQADAVIYVCSVETPLSLNEQLFLKTMICPQKYTDLLVVANYGDFLRPNDYERVCDFLHSRIRDLIPEQKISIVSALDEQCRQLNEERPNPRLESRLAANFDAFRNELEELIQTKRELFLPGRIQRISACMKEELLHILENMEFALTLDQEQLVKTMEELKEQRTIEQNTWQETIQNLKQKIETMKDQTSEWMDTLLRKMTQEVDSLQNTPADDLRKYYTIYCIDTIQTALNQCVEYHLEEIYDSLDKINEELLQNIHLSSGTAKYGFRFSLDTKTWTKGDNISYIASKSPTLQMFGIVLDGISGAMREKEMANATPKIIDNIKKQYVSFQTSVRETIDKTYQSLEDNVNKHLVEYYNDIQQTNQTNDEEVLRVSRQSVEKKEEMQSAIQTVKQVLNKLSE